MLIANPNLTIDRTLAIDELRLGEVLRFTRAEITPGGKGVNVARVARALGHPALLVSFVPGRTGAAVAELLGDEGLALAPVPTRGEVRAAIVVLEESGRTTVMNEPGPPVGEAEWAAYEREIEARLEGHRILVCSGSVPPGAPADAYARLVRLARARRVPALVDAAGETLAAALEAGPEVVTPNFVEAEGVLLGTRAEEADVPYDEAKERSLEAAARLAAKVDLAIVTAGAAGVAVAAGADRMWIDAPSVAVRNSVGAGDSFVGGFAVAIERGETAEGAVRAGVATAAASVESPLAGGVDPERVRELTALIAAR